MTVKELIERLSRMEPDRIVVLACDQIACTERDGGIAFIPLASAESLPDTVEAVNFYDDGDQGDVSTSTVVQDMPGWVPAVCLWTAR